ncbi:MAG TPA: TonB-dependent receptor [Vicinamibacterales bacterium]
MTRTFLAAAGMMCILLGDTVFIRAQGVQTGTLRGSIVDPQEQPVPGVTVSIASPALQGQRTAVSDELGTYVFRALPPGDYTVTFTLPSFATEERKLAVPLGGTVEQNVKLKVAAVSEEVSVSGQVPPPLASGTVGLNIKHDEVEALATSRTLQGIATLSPSVNDITPNTGQLVINGAFAFDNVFMLNGVDVNDNLFGSPQDLFIEDAIQETQVLTSGISAEFGRFSGGVVNAITKSGSNSFSGSYRANLTNPSWVAETPFEQQNGVEHQNTLSASHEATFGGPIARDRLWFFAAGRLASTSLPSTLDQTGYSYTRQDDNKRGEVKVTATVAPNHTLQGGYLNNATTQNDRPSFPFSIDRFTLDTRSLPNWYTFGNYRGILRNNLLAEAQYSERRFGFRDSGGTSANIVDSPIITLTQDLGHYNAPYFDATDPENRNNRQLTGNITYFAEGRGRHEVKAGYEWFRSQLTGGNSQSATNYVFDADYATGANGGPIYDAGGYLIPVFVPGATLLENWPAMRGAVLNVDTQSAYAQDHWTINRHLSADLGLRFERARSDATGDIVGVDTDTIVPRLGVAFDAKGDGSLIFHSTYGHYSGRYNEAQIGANNNVSNPDETIAVYTGPAGQGRNFAPGFDPSNYDIFFGRFPTANVSFASGLSSPITKEFTVSGGKAVGQRAYGEVTYVWRHMTDIIEDFIDTTNGFTHVVKNGIDYGTFTNSVYRNSDLPTRKYQGLVFQGRYTMRPNWTVNGNWTIQLQNDGNYEGEAANQPGLPSPIGDYPEAFSEARHYPMGRLQSYQQHRARVWSVYDFGVGHYGRLAVSGLVRMESGQVFSYKALNVPLTATQEALLASYPDAPSQQDVYFGERGAGTFPGYAALDLSLNYDVPVFRTVRPWLKLDVFNVTNNDTLIGYNTNVVPDPNSPTDALGLPTGYIKGPNFGKPQSITNYPGSQAGLGGEITRGRTFRMAVGIRF